MYIYRKETSIFFYLNETQQELGVILAFAINLWSWKYFSFLYN